jgi:hypothetical protein
LPASYRWAVIIAVVIGFQVALSAAFDVNMAMHIDSPSVGEEQDLALAGISPEVQHQVWLTQRASYQAAVSSMLPWRLISSALLALGSALVFFFGMRLRLSVEDRARSAELLGFAAVGAALMRSIDGAQSLVIVRTMATETARVMLVEASTEVKIGVQAGMTITSIMSVVWSLTMVAVFVSLSSYFRSERLRDALAREEG